MKKITLFFFLLINIFIVKGQDYSKYHPSATLINNLVNTKLKVSFDIPNEKLFGEAWITLQPHFSPTDSLTLDAKGMEIDKVTLNNKNLNYTYINSKLKIKLDKTYKKDDNYTVYIKYTAIPANVKVKGSAAIQEAKGLYFINPRGEEKDKPTQIWTQGEPVGSSCWFPTIDQPNQKTSQDIYITVPSKYVTLSNGTLQSKTQNNDGTRTDYWKLDKKHAPYLAFMGIGEFSIVKDQWKNIPVEYYVEKEYEPYAKQIFGDTPEMIEFFSNLLKYPYPWEKYSQMVARDYVSGAMENTTATLHAEDAQQKPGQLIDENAWEPVIAHELFHHWFGDLVTMESWANLTLNESFADYSEYLWLAHKYGKDKAEDHKNADKNAYLMGNENFVKDLVRFQYRDKGDMFDEVSYGKGGIILHMLRNYLGDEAFFAGLTKYLQENAYKAAEAHQLRLALEEVSGKDLNWFFNQWYFGHGHPKLKISYTYNDANKKVIVNIKQTQSPKFQFPLDIDIYENGKAIRHQVWAKATEDNSFELPYNKKVQLINVNPDDILLCQITDDKTPEQYIFQYKSAPEYYSRRTAIEKLAEVQSSNNEALETLLKAANSEKFEGLRKLAISKIDKNNVNSKEKITAELEKIALNDSKTLVQAEAITKLGEMDPNKYSKLFEKTANSPSYAVKAASLLALVKTKPALANTIAKSITDNNPGNLLSDAIVKVNIINKDTSDLLKISKSILRLILRSESQEEANTYFDAIHMIMGGDYKQETKNIIDFITKVYPDGKKYNFGEFLLQLAQGCLSLKQQASNNNPSNQSLKNQVKYISDALSKMK